jgi:lipopolysaccharide export system permease protein
VEITAVLKHCATLKTLHFYLTQQVMATLLMTVAVFTFVLLLGNGLKEILELLIRRQATLSGVAEAFALLIPWVLVFALPMGMLTAALLVFGRFSADQELTAVRSSGISLVTLITPVLVLSVLLCGVSAWINMEIAPRCRVAYKGLIDQMKLTVVNAGLPEGRAIRDFKGYMIYLTKSDGTNMQGIQVYCYDAANNVTNFIYAQRGNIEIENKEPVLHMYQLAQFFQQRDGSWSPGETGEFRMALKQRQAASVEERIAVTDLTFRQLQTELRDLENSASLPDTEKMTSKEARLQVEALRQRRQDMIMPLRVQLNRQVAISFACFGFTLVGIPLGIRAHRRETNAGIAMALVLVFVYYSFIIVGQALQSHAEFAPYLIVWAPNFLFQTVGAVMLWRANRGI